MFRRKPSSPAPSSQSSQTAVDFTWRAVIIVFVCVLAASAGAIIVSIWVPPIGGKVAGDTAPLITIFSTSIGFLAGTLTGALTPGSIRNREVSNLSTTKYIHTMFWPLSALNNRSLYSQSNVNVLRPSQPDPSTPGLPSPHL
jgi:hypothetical protein